MSWWRARVLRTNLSNLPTLQAGELAYADDVNQLWVGATSGNKQIVGGGGGGSQGATGLQGVTGIAGGSFPNVYSVPTAYSTIQAAIDAAFADGHTQFVGNPAVVEIAPGIYSESLNLRAGISLLGISAASSNVQVVGDATFVANINQSQNENRLVMNGIQFSGKVELSGSVASRLSLLHSAAIQPAGSTNPSVLLNNTLGRFDSASSFIIHNDPAGIAADIRNGNFVCSDQTGGIFNNASSVTASLIKLTGTSTTSLNSIFIGGNNTGAPNMIEMASATASCFLKGVNVLNAQSGGNNILFSANGTVRALTSVFSNNGGKFAVTTSGGGILGFAGCTIDGSNEVDPTITIQFSKNDMRLDPFAGRLFVGGRNGFPNFTTAFAYAVAHNMTFLKLIVEAGTYNDNIIVPPTMNVQIMAAANVGLTNFAQVFVNGQVTHAPTTNTTFTMENIRISAGAGKNCVNYTTSATTFPSFRYCEFVKTGDNLPAVFISAPIGLSFHDCDIQVLNCNAPALDVTGINCIFHGLNLFGQNDIEVGGSAAIDPTFSLPFVKIRNNSNITMYGVTFNTTPSGGCGTFFELNTNSAINCIDCNMSTALQVGQLFYFKGSGGTVYGTRTTYGIAGNPILPELTGTSYSAFARDGVVATGSITIANNTFNAGDSVTVAGVPFVVNTDFTPGGSTAATATALATAINAKPALAQVVYAIANGTSVVTLYSYKFAASSNSITLSKTDAGTVNFVLSGATLTGGSTGTANSFQRDYCSFLGWAINSQNTLTEFSNPVVPIPF